MVGVEIKNIDEVMEVAIAGTWRWGHLGEKEYGCLLGAGAAGMTV